MHLDLLLGASHVQIPLCEQVRGAKARSPSGRPRGAGREPKATCQCQGQTQGGRGETRHTPGQIRGLGAEEGRPRNQGQRVRGKGGPSRQTCIRSGR